jgi:hypothetical protein
MYPELTEAAQRYVVGSIERFFASQRRSSQGTERAA